MRYVTRMRRNPSSGINQKDAEIILRFLLYYTKQVALEEDGASEPPEPPPPPSLTSDTEPAAPVPAPEANANSGGSDGSMTPPANEAPDGGLL